MIAEPLPLYRTELFVGIDLGKTAHMASFVSSSLLRRHKQYRHCPTLPFSNSRQGFEKLLKAMKAHAPLARCAVLVEKTGHYGYALIEYLQDQGIAVYTIHVQKRLSRDKTDRRDAQNLGNMFYNQIGLGAQVENKEMEIRRLLAPSELALHLRGLVQHDYELDRECTRRKNKLGAIADQLFPEASQIFRDLHCQTALNLRQKFDTPAQLAAAPFSEVKACRPRNKPGNAKLLHLQALAAQTIGIKDPLRVESLVFQKHQLIAELRMLQANQETLDQKITDIVTPSRQGRILMSTGIIGPVQAAAIIATIGNIENFEKPGQLKALFGWAPVQDQTGTSYDLTRLTKGGSRVMKRCMYLIAWTAIREDTEWRDLYQRLLKKNCAWDEKTKDYRGKSKVIGRIVGQIIELIFHLLWKDHEVVAATPPGEEPPEPILYDRDIHRKHRGRGIS